MVLHTPDPETSPLDEPEWSDVRTLDPKASTLAKQNVELSNYLY